METYLDDVARKRYVVDDSVELREIGEGIGCKYTPESWFEQYDPDDVTKRYPAQEIILANLKRLLNLVDTKTTIIQQIANDPHIPGRLIELLEDKETLEVRLEAARIVSKLPAELIYECISNVKDIIKNDSGELRSIAVSIIGNVAGHSTEYAERCIRKNVVVFLVNTFNMRRDGNVSYVKTLSVFCNLATIEAVGRLIKIFYDILNSWSVPDVKIVSVDALRKISERTDARSLMVPRVSLLEDYMSVKPERLARYPEYVVANVLKIYIHLFSGVAVIPIKGEVARRVIRMLEIPGLRQYACSFLSILVKGDKLDDLVSYETNLSVAVQEFSKETNPEIKRMFLELFSDVAILANLLQLRQVLDMGVLETLQESTGDPNVEIKKKTVETISAYLLAGSFIDYDPVKRKCKKINMKRTLRTMDKGSEEISVKVDDLLREYF